MANPSLRRLRNSFARFTFEAPGLALRALQRPHVAGVDRNVVRET